MNISDTKDFVWTGFGAIKKYTIHLCKTHKKNMESSSVNMFLIKERVLSHTFYTKD